MCCGNVMPIVVVSEKLQELLRNKYSDFDLLKKIC